MIFFFSSLVVNPCFYILFPILLSFVFRRAILKRVLYGISLVLFLLFTNTPLLRVAEEQWYESYDIPLDSTKTYEYGIVLGGYGQWDWKRNRIEYGTNAARLIEGIRLYKMGKIKKLVLASDGSIIQRKDKNGPEGNPEGMMKYLNNLGVPSQDIIMELYANNTRENVTLTMKLLGNALQSSNVLVITSAVHMKRSLHSFYTEGIYPDYYLTDTWPNLNGVSENFIPSLYTLIQWQELLHEWIGLVAYKLRGW